MWDTLIVNPMINALLWFYGLFDNFIIAIAVFTLLIRLITLPLNLRSQRSMMKNQEMAPQVQAIQKKYRNEPQKMQEEFRKIGYNPADTLTGCFPQLLQFPVLIGLYQAISIILGSTPQALYQLAPRVYPGIDLTSIIPVDNKFLWLNLGMPDPFFVLPLLVVGTMFLQQKILTPKTNRSATQGDDPAQAMTQSMQYTMPLMFGFFSLQFPAGLSIYFILGNLLGIAQGMYMKATHKKTAPPSGPKVVEGQSVEAGTKNAAETSTAVKKSTTPKSTTGTSKTTSDAAAKNKKRSAKR